MNMRYSLTALRAFEAAGRNISMTKAAAELFVTRPAISKQIRVLEKELGCSLFIRSRGRLQLTDPGAELLSTLTHSLFQMMEAADRVRRSTGSGEKLRILVEHDFAASWLASNVGHYLIEQPGQPMDLVTERQGNLRLEEDFDFRIFYSTSTILKDHLDRFDIRELCGWVNLPLCAPDYVQREADAPDVVLRESQILHDRDRRFWTEWLRQGGLDEDLAKTGGTVFDSTSLCLSAAVSGAGIAIGDTLIAHEFLKFGKLIPPFPYGVRSHSSYLLLSKKGEIASRQNMAFESWILDRFNQFVIEQEVLLSDLNVKTTYSISGYGSHS